MMEIINFYTYYLIKIENKIFKINLKHLKINNSLK